MSDEPSTCDGWREHEGGSHDHFPYFRPARRELEALQVETAPEELIALVERLNGDHRHVIDNVEDELLSAMEPAGREAREQAGQLDADTRYVKYALLELGDKVTWANHNRDGRYGSSIDDLNERYRENRSLWEVPIDEPDGSGGDPPYMPEVRANFIAQLNREWCYLNDIVEEAAADAATKIGQGPTPDNLRSLYAVGALPADPPLVLSTFGDRLPDDVQLDLAADAVRMVADGRMSLTPLMSVLAGSGGIEAHLLLPLFDPASGYLSEGDLQRFYEVAGLGGHGPHSATVTE